MYFQRNNATPHNELSMKYDKERISDHSGTLRWDVRTSQDVTSNADADLRSSTWFNV